MGLAYDFLCNKIDMYLKINPPAFASLSHLPKLGKAWTITTWTYSVDMSLSVSIETFQAPQGWVAVREAD